MPSGGPDTLAATGAHVRATADCGAGAVKLDSHFSDIQMFPGSGILPNMDLLLTGKKPDILLTQPKVLALGPEA